VGAALRRVAGLGRRVVAGSALRERRGATLLRVRAFDRVADRGFIRRNVAKPDYTGNRVYAEIIETRLRSFVQGKGYCNRVRRKVRSAAFWERLKDR